MIIDGRQIASERGLQLKQQINSFNFPLKIVAIIVGHDPASKKYVAMKNKLATELGLTSEIIQLPENSTSQQLLDLIEKLNQEETTTGILVQLPLPSHIDYRFVLNSISPEKDVDGLTDSSPFLPATVKGILSVLPDLNDKTVVVVGQGKLVGKPLSDELQRRGVKVITADDTTSDLKGVTLQGDVLVVATGVEKLIRADMVKKGAIVIDCGAPKAEVDFEAVSQVASAITPVPGGVGPLTIVSLLENTLEAAKIAANTHTERTNP